MRLPDYTAKKSLYSSRNNTLSLQSADSSANIEMSLDIPCLLSCLGTTALSCISCGLDLSCWLTCAGPKALDCTKCF